MFKIVLISLALTGLQALPISRSLTKTHHDLPSGVQDGLPVPVAEGFRQDTEPSRRFIVDLNTGLVQDYVSEMDRKTGLPSSSLGNGHGEMDRRHWLSDNILEEVPVQKTAGGWVRVEERPTLPDGFRQGTEPSLGIPKGFRQGTEPSIRIPDGFKQGTERFIALPDGFRQGTEPSNRIPKGFRQGTEPTFLVPSGFRRGTERFMPIPDGFRQGTEPSIRIPNGFRQGTEPKDPSAYREIAKPAYTLPKGFRQGTEPTFLTDKEIALSLSAKAVNTIPDGFRQGTEPSNRIPNGFRQGTEPRDPSAYREIAKPVYTLPKGFRQGTEPTFLSDREIALSLSAKPVNTLPKGFRQGTEPTFLSDREIALSLSAKPVNTLPKGFRQGTEPTFLSERTNPLDHKDVALLFKDVPAESTNLIVEGFQPGSGPFMPVRDGQPSNHIEVGILRVNEVSESKQKPNTAECKGDIINGRCYTFNPTPMPFLEAQDSCKSLSQKAELASVTDEDLHSRLVSMVTNGGLRDPVMTWLGGTVKNQRGSWLDGSEWRYSDWMPGQPNIHTDKPVCMEMFRMDETWWTAADCDLKRASICSYPVLA